MASAKQHIIDTFLAETDDRLLDIESGILAMESFGSRMDPELIHAIFRDAHSVKAGANLLNLRNIETLAHRLENILDMVRHGRITPDDALISCLLEALDRIRELVENLEASDRMDISAQLESLARCAPTADDPA